MVHLPCSGGTLRTPGLLHHPLATSVPAGIATLVTRSEGEGPRMAVGNAAGASGRIFRAGEGPVSMGESTR
jgi:hypothetical protein